MPCALRELGARALCPVGAAESRPWRARSILEPRRTQSPTTARVAPGVDGHAGAPAPNAAVGEGEGAAVADAALTAGAGSAAALRRMRGGGEGQDGATLPERQQRPERSHVPALADVLANGAVVGVAMGVGLGLVWSGVAVALRTRWARADGSVAAARLAALRVASAGCFAAMQPLLKGALDALVFVWRGRAVACRAVTPAGAERRVSVRRRVLAAVLNNEVNGSLTVGAVLFVVFVAVDAATPVQEVARITAGLGFGFFLQDVARQVGDRVVGRVGSYFTVAVGARDLQTVSRRLLREVWMSTTGHMSFDKIVGDHSGKWAALAGFPYIEDHLGAGIDTLYGVPEGSELGRWQRGGRIFLVNVVFFFWAENVIRLFSLLGRKGQAAFDRRRGSSHV